MTAENLPPHYSETMNETIKKKLRTLPETPGVYLMKNDAGKIIYVGKAKVLKNRVRQYFMNMGSHTPKVLAMVSNIADFEYILTDTETEAFVLECNLIKKYRPHYNILLKDDKQYPYIRVTMEKEYPDITLARKADDPKSRYFGPYISSATVHNTISLVRNIFKIAHCKKSFPRDIGKERACLYRSMGQCSAPCQNLISGEEYHRVFEEVCDFLAGKHTELLKRLDAEMKEASKHLEFEKAASVRDRIIAIEKLMEKQKVSSVEHTNVDVFALSIGEKDAVVCLLYIRDGKVGGNEQFVLPNISDVEDSEILNSFVNQYYAALPYIPDMVVLPEEIPEQEALYEFLREQKGKIVELRVPRKGVYSDLLKMAEKNAQEALQNHAPGMAERKEIRVLDELQSLLGLPHPPRRIESYDISHLSGTQCVGAVIVMKDGKPDRKHYIRMQIKGGWGNNDYASMNELVFRRFRHRQEHPESELFAPLPDLILMDGGVSQMQAASEAMEAVGVQIPVFGLVKDDHHRTRGMVSREGEVTLMPFGSVFRFLTLVQEEVHKTAISYHRMKRAENAKQSALLEIDGIGAAKGAALMKHFRSIQKIKNAGIDALSDVKGIGPRDAERIYRHFHPYESK